ncbi:MAG: efflux RND transporter periplasmic adaptor subunit [Candidatus Kapabacteria bacterium]|nr:efflux RND transporter periplasmic adaptor subunit [Candidatus Kapabacteria bacterium]
MAQQTPDLSSLRINRNPQQDYSGGSRRWWKIPLLTVVVLLIAGAAYSWFSSSSLNAVEVDAAVATLSSPSQENAVLTASGYVVAQRKAAVSSKVVGRLVALNVIEGDVVRTGQVIGRLESADIEAQLAQQRASVAMANADKENAEADLAEARRELERIEPLALQGASTKQQRDMAASRVAKAEAFLRTRSAAIAVQEAAIRAAQVQLENTLIRAPFDGTVLTKNANVGEVLTTMGASAGSRGALVTLADMSSLEVEADVSESQIQKIIPGQPCEITLNAYSDKRYQGVVSKIIPTADRSKATVLVKVRFTNKDDNVLPEMAAKVLFMKPESQTSTNESPKLSVPVSAVVERGGQRVIYVIEGGKAREQAVQTGAVANGFVVITSGVASGATYITTPPADMKNGTAVKVKQ